MLDIPKFLKDVEFESVHQENLVGLTLELAQNSWFSQRLERDNNYVNPYNMIRIAASKGYSVIIRSKTGYLQAYRENTLYDTIEMLKKAYDPNGNWPINVWNYPITLDIEDNFGNLWNYPNSASNTFCFYFSDEKQNPFGPRRGDNLVFNYYMD